MFAAELVLSGDMDELSSLELWAKIGTNYAVEETAYIRRLLSLTKPIDEQQLRNRSLKWVQAIRSQQSQSWGVEPLLQEFSLNTKEGIALMTLAESLIRVPDSHSADALIEDRLCSADWNSQKETQSPLWLNMSSWALAQARHLYSHESEESEVIGQMVKRLGEPLLRTALQQALAMLADRFVLGESIYEALDKSQAGFQQGNSYSFDMLGEAALCSADSERYLTAYIKALQAISQNESYPENHIPASISVKLSALHPRFEALKGEEMLLELQVSMTILIKEARNLDIAITIDAEESDRLEPTLRLFEALYHGPAKGWGKLGLAVQAYSKRALPVLCWLNALTIEQHDPIPVRLVKGAYWDTEIKLAQQRGQSDYPVFTRKSATDISYLACARYLLSEHSLGLEPQFATHNAQTLSQVLDFYQQTEKPFECQRLHGMGESLYQHFSQDNRIPCRIYAPVGSHKELLPYLVRRLLENGANSSFVSHILDPTISTTEITQLPQQLWKQDPSYGLTLPADLYAPRTNSKGINLHIYSQRKRLIKNLNKLTEQLFIAAPIINGEPMLEGQPTAVLSPQNHDHVVGECYQADTKLTEQAIEQVVNSLPTWNKQPVSLRARILDQFADSLEIHGAELLHLCIYEAGKTLQDALDELREAVDFCRYYALQGNKLMGAPLELAGVTGESNRLLLTPRGVFACISPWNFPLAIFVGQIAAALVCGNGVIAKPARQTSLIAYRCCQLLLDAGLPSGILALLPGPSEKISEALLSHDQIRGVAFTGSTATAQHINCQLALRNHAPIAAIIAETGGQNAMIADSTALPEQIVKDAIQSAFGSSGQRCSALRVLFLQEDIADNVIKLLIGAMNQLNQGPPERLHTDLGPVIDRDALNKLQTHLEDMKRQGNLIHQLSQPRALKQGYFCSPALIKIDSIDQLQEEHFGPILHIVRYPANQVMRVVDDINRMSYGLTLAIHSRNETHIRQIEERAQVGNIYINRNQVGAVVEAQPFGGQGLSGTGPKAGGPNYLMRFLCEKTITTNTTAWGGNASLLSDTGKRK